MSKTMEPYLMSVLSSRLYSIGLEMTNTLMRTARSQLMSVCHDLSTAICDRNGKVIALAESIPVHCANMGLTVSPCFSHPDGIQQGDLFLNNSPYHGNTHHADYTYIAPVFNEGELMFFAVTKGHQADIGNAIPSTYAPTARDMFEEGAIDWPCIKIQRDYKDVADIIKIAQMHNRVPEMWYGDYLACVGSSRVGEKRLAALCAEYGNEKFKDFCEAYQAYGAKRMREELKQLPKGHYEYDIKADAIEGVVPEITIHIECDTHPEDGTIAFDFTKNADSLPCGLNMCEATTLASAVTGVLNRMTCDIPCTDGAMSQIKVKMREGCVIGKAKAPYSSSMATTNLADRVISGVQALMNEITDKKGMAEGGLFSDIVSEYSGSHYTTTADFDYKGVNTLLKALRDEAMQFFARNHIEKEYQRIELYMEAHYPFQVYELPVNITADLNEDFEITPAGVKAMEQAFHKEHERTFSIKDDTYIECVSWRVKAIGKHEREAKLPEAKLPANRDLAYEEGKSSSFRKIYFKEYDNLKMTPVFLGDRLVYGDIVHGPAIIEEPTTTIVVLPGYCAKVTKHNSYCLEKETLKKR